MKKVIVSLYLFWLLLSPIGEEIEDKMFLRENLKKHFPDWPERVAYEDKMIKIYQSAMKKVQMGQMNYHLRYKLTKQEQSAINYFTRKGFYEIEQDSRTPPNIFDSRQSFLIKMENDDMRNKFLNTYNKRYPIQD